MRIAKIAEKREISAHAPFRLFDCQGDGGGLSGRSLLTAIRRTNGMGYNPLTYDVDGLYVSVQ